MTTKILVVHHRAISRKNLSTLLRDCNHQLFEASDGAQARKIALAEHPDLILSDILMPEMDGFELVKELRADPRISDTPVIFYSATFRAEQSRELAKPLGVAPILPKPSESEVIIGTVNDILGRRGRRASTANAATDAAINPDRQGAKKLPPRSQSAPKVQGNLSVGAKGQIESLADTHVSNPDATDVTEHITRLETSARQLATLTEIAAEILREKDPTRLLRRACGAARDLVGAEFASVTILDEEQQKQDYFIVTGMDKARRQSLSAPIPHAGLFGHLLRDGRSRQWFDGEGDPAKIGLPASYPRIRSLLILPLVIGSKVRGWLYVANKTLADQFDHSDEDSCAAVTTLLVLAFENICQREDLAARSRLAAFSSAVSAALTKSGSLQEVLLTCAENMVEYLDAAFARIWTLDDAKSVLELQASAGLYTHIDGGHGRVPVGQFKIGLIASERKPHLTNSVIGDPRVNDQEWAKREAMVAFAGYPLLVEDTLVGVMAMFARKPLTPSTLQAMESVSKSIAASILRKQIDEEKQHEVARIRAILETALDCIITMDHDGKILEFNPAAEQTFGYTRSAVIGKELAELMIPPHLRERHRRGLTHYLSTGYGPVLGKRIDISAMRADGSEFPIELIISGTSIGGRTTFTGFVRDVSDRKKAEERIQRNIERMEALREIEKSITSTLDLNTVLNVLLEKIDIFFAKSSAATVKLFDKDTGQLEPVAARNIDIGEWIAAMRGDQDNQKSYARAVIEQRAPLTIPDLQTDSRTQNPHFYREHGLISYAGVPLIAKGEVFGVLGIYTKEEHSFSSEEIELLMILAGQTAIAIHNARLYDHAQRQLKRMQGVSEINKAITSTLSLKNVLDVLLEKTQLFCPVAVACGVRLFDEASGNMVPMASCHIPFEEWKEDVGNAKGRLTTILMETLRPLAILNMHTDSRRLVNHFARRHGLISYLGVPLIFREKFLGNLVIYTKEEHAFSEEEIEFFTNLGSQAAIAIHNASLYEQTERRRSETEELARIGRSLTETLDTVAVATRIVTSVRELFRAKGSTIRILEADGSLRSLASCGEVFSKTLDGKLIPGDMGLSGRAISEGRPIWSADTSTDEGITLSQSMHDFNRRTGNGSIAVVPLRAHEKITGTLTLTDQTGRSYSENEVVLLQTFANQAAMALVNAQLFQTIETSKQQLATTNQFLEHSLKKLGSLYTAMTPLALSESLSEMVNAIIERLMEATGADAALIRVWDRDAGNYPAIGQRGYTDDFVESFRPERAAGAIQWVIQHGEPIIAPDVSLEVRFRGKKQIALGFRSCTVLPLHVHGDIRGVIQLSSRKRGYFDAEQKDHLMAVARQMSVALENRELFYNLQASRNELERANKVKDEFLNVMSHELRTPLGIIIGYSTLLREQGLGPLTQGQEQGVDVIQRNSKELFTMLDSIMNATKIEAGSMMAELAAVSPVELLRELKLIYDFPTGKAIRLEWNFPETLPILQTDARKLRQILTNLINNAIKFTDKGAIVISAEERLEGDVSSPRRWIEFRVSDSGIGILPEECDKIFERFHQVDSSTTRSFEGVGLGLYIVKSFTEMLNGRVAVSSKVGQGSTFTIRIPCDH